MDFFGRRASAELQAFKSSAKTLDEARQAEIHRLGSLLQSTIMKLLAVTDREAHRVVRLSETEPKVQQVESSSGFLRRDSAASALKKSREAANGQ